MPSKSAVLDASAVLAWLFREPGSEQVQAWLEEAQCYISSVNLAEIITRGCRLMGERVPEFIRLVQSINMTLYVFDENQALKAGLLDGITRGKGLSLGDRACLALAGELDATVLTADKTWLELELNMEIVNIREPITIKNYKEP